MKKVLITILVIIVFVLGSYFMYKKVWPRLDKRITVTEEFNVKLDEEKKEDEQEETKKVVAEVKYDTNLVEDAYSYNEKYTIKPICSNEETEVTINVKLPKINIDKPNALKLNEKILNDFSEYTKYDENNEVTGNKKISYTFLEWDNYLFIYMNGLIENLCAGGSNINNIYYYDIENDKILNTEEIFNAVGFTQEDLYNSTKKNNSYLNSEEIEKYSTFEWCDENNDTGCGCGLKHENGSFEIFNHLQCS